ncbi:MAG TPA: hypothetical protein VMF56_12790 [Acidobacteriaceae bacterium]|nr:hypothetical protein [Acidobacteriaceae bacterium]
MKKIVWGFVLSCMVFAGASRKMWAAKPAATGDDYNINVHVSGAQYASDGLNEVLMVVIGGRHYELQGPTSSAKMYSHGNGLMNPGDYHAKLIQDTHKTTYESIQEYEFLLPDGTKRKFAVIAQSE